MSFCVTIFWVPEIFFRFIFFVAMSDFIYHYLLASLYVFAISVVIVKNDLENKIIHVLSLSDTSCIKFFSCYHLIILKYYPTHYVKKHVASWGVIN
jgi:hypothetical protein